MKKTIISLAVIGSSLLSNVALANPGSYLTDSRGQVVKSGTGLCIHTSSWKPGDTMQGCDEPVSENKVTQQPALDRIIMPPVVETVKPKEHKHATISANLLFGFDKYNLTMDGKNLLTELMESITVDNIHAVIVVGHTDPIGSEEYNQNLSAKRAQAVKDFLISKGFASELIQSEGKGETQLKTTKADCKGQELIECFAPNRRVEIRMSE